MAAVEDQQPVQTFGADGADEALGDRVRLRCPHRRLQDPDPFAAKDLIEGAGVLAVAVADQMANLLFGEGEAEVAGLLGNPASVWVGRAAGKMDAAAAVFDEEEHIEAAKEHRLNGEEITGDDARRLRPKELGPAPT